MSDEEKEIEPEITNEKAAYSLTNLAENLNLSRLVGIEDKIKKDNPPPADDNNATTNSETQQNSDSNK